MTPRMNSSLRMMLPSMHGSLRSIGRSTPLALALGLVVISASPMGSTPAHAQNAAIVNGKAIPKSRVDDFVKALAAQGRPDNEETRKLVRDELIARELFAQEADKANIANDPEVKKQLETMRQDALIRGYVRDYLKKNPVTDKEIQAEYDKFKKETAETGKEYKASHILVDKEEDANEILARLKKGDKFEDVAKEKSKDPGSGASGGDLGWNSAGTFVKEFSEAMVALKKGETTAKPVKSQFGYHIIRLDDSRDSEPPPLEQVKPQIQQQLERQRVQDLQKKLRETAKIE